MDNLSARERFRLAGRRVMRFPSDQSAHEARIRIAIELDGAEPVQGALADMLHACPPAPENIERLLGGKEICERLDAGTLNAMRTAVLRREGLPRVTRHASRYSILAMPSLDVPPRAMLCGEDDSRKIAALALPSLLAGDRAEESAFLDHCEGALDIRAFMLARRVMVRERKTLSARWRDVAEALERGLRT